MQKISIHFNKFNLKVIFPLFDGVKNYLNEVIKIAIKVKFNCLVLPQNDSLKKDIPVICKL